MAATSSSRLGARIPIAVFGASLLLLCSLLSLLSPGNYEALPVIAVLAVGTFVALRSRTFGAWWPYAGAVITAAAVPWLGGGDSPLLPYLLTPGLSLGLLGGTRELATSATVSAAALLVSAALPGATRDHEVAVGGAEWLILSTSLGLVATWSRRAELQADRPDGYEQVRHLLKQLRSQTRDLPGGLDAPSTADGILERWARVVPQARSAVLAQPTGGAFVPLAVRGTKRVPWRAPLDTDGPLRTAWESGVAVIDRRLPDRVGRRRGSCLIAVPLLASHRPFGLVILETFDLEIPDEPTITQLTEIVEDTAPRLETALLFEEVRLVASTEERDHIAREIHDGIAQELAFVGYRLDELRVTALRVDADLAESIATLRRELTGMVSDLRLSITGLRTTVRPDRGLGTVLGTYLQAVCSGKHIVLNLSLQETAFRLPAEQEGALLKAVQIYAQDLRHARGVTTLNVQLVVDPPSVLLELRSDGPPVDIRLGEIAGMLRGSGAEVTTSPGALGGALLRIEFEGGPDDDLRPARGRPRTDQAGPAAGVRAD